ncbi:hypothetical protein [Kitasatospora nipponensis]
MTSSLLASTIGVLGAVGGFGLLGLLLGRDLDRTGRHGRDNWHRGGGYPHDPDRPDRLHAATPVTGHAAPAARTAPVPAPRADRPGRTDRTGRTNPADRTAPVDRLRGTLPAASDLRFGTLARWTSSSAPRTNPTSVPRARSLSKPS